MRLEGKVALVTGGTGRIGAATCERLAGGGPRGGRRHRSRPRPGVGRRPRRRRGGDGRALDGVRRRRRRPGGVRAGSDRRAREQRRGRRGRLLHAHQRGDVGSRDRREPARGARRDPCRAARHARARRRLDRQRGLRGRARRLAALHRLLGHQGRRDRLHEGSGQGVRALRGAGQRGRAGADRDADDARRPRGPRRAG